jgi:hypothetical protein
MLWFKARAREIGVLGALAAALADTFERSARYL